MGIEQNGENSKNHLPPKAYEILNTALHTALSTSLRFECPKNKPRNISFSHSRLKLF